MDGSTQSAKKGDGSGNLQILLTVGLAWIIYLALGLWRSWPTLQSGDLSASGDDFMRLLQVYEFLDGAHWFDVLQERMNPPEGVLMHWSRLPDLPLALIIGGLEPWLGRVLASQIAVTAVPAGLMAATLLTLSLIVRQVFDRRAVGLCLLVVLLGMPAIAQFFPTRVDHHNWQMFLSVLMLYGVIRSWSDAKDWGGPIITGLAIACSLWIGTEAVPWIACANIALFFAALKNDDQLRGGLVQAQLALVLSATFLVLTVPFDSIWVARCDSHSVFYVGLTIVTVFTWVSMVPTWQLTSSPTLRFAITSLVGGSALGALLWLFPQCVGGPYAEIDPLVAEKWLSRITEAQNAWSIIQASPLFATYYFIMPLLGTVIASYLLVTRKDLRERGLFAIWLFLVIAFAQALIQNRALRFADLYAAIPVAWMLFLFIDVKRSEWTPIKRLGLAAITIYCLSPLLPANLQTLFPSLKTSVSEGLAQFKDGECSINNVKQELNQLEQSVILGTSNMGPVLLFHTKHSIVTANYHRNTKGILSGLRFLESQTDEEAKGIITAHNTDYVLLCPNSSQVKEVETGFVADLMQGTIPDWMRLVPFQADSSLRLYEIRNEMPLRNSLP